MALMETSEFRVVDGQSEEQARITARRCLVLDCGPGVRADNKRRKVIVITLGSPEGSVDPIVLDVKGRRPFESEHSIQKQSERRGVDTMTSGRMITKESCREAMRVISELGARAALVVLSQREPELAAHIEAGMAPVWEKLASYGL